MAKILESGNDALMNKQRRRRGLGTCRLVTRISFGVVALGALLALSGCRDADDPPHSQGAVMQPASARVRLEEQAQAVRSGKSDVIQIDGLVVDGALACLAGLDGLRELQLQRANISDEGAAALGRLSGLEVLVLRGEARLSDEGLKHLHALTKLKRLVLDGTHITDDGLPLLAAFSELEILRLDSRWITDRGVAHFAVVKNLKTLILVNAPITDASISHFKAMSQLESLYLFGDELSEQGRDELREAMPHVNW